MGEILRPKILLTGKNGQVGWELQRTLATLGDVVALDSQQLDLADPDQIRQRVREIKPDLIINPAAYTAVDRAEEDPDLARAINGIAPGILAEEAKRINAAMIHYSSDYVFDGFTLESYTEEDKTNPNNVYGRTKLEGERAIQAVGVPHLVLRISWVYGLRGKNFLMTVLRLAQEREELSIVDDQFGAPTWCRMVAEATAQMISSFSRGGESLAELLGEKSGVYHMSSAGGTSWYGFARAIFDLIALPGVILPHIEPIPARAYPTPARRPASSLLSNDKLNKTFGITLPEWDLALKLLINEN
ncbi:MAG: dTDP-4-dehydrorhamnose reductase [Bacillota bacterium]